MKHERKFRDDDWYEDEPYSRRREKGRDRRRKGEAEIWADMVQSSEDLAAPDPSPRRETREDPRPQQAPRQPGQPWQPPFRMDEESTVEVKGFRIDLSRVDHLTKLDTTYNGRPSHGIEFAFFGKRGLGRTIWYGTNSRQRDEEYDRYEAIRLKAAERGARR